MVENISLESLDLKDTSHEKPDLSAKMSPEEKRRYRNKLLFVWGIPVILGIFSFVYWFVFVPILWANLPYQHWPLLWFILYGVVAFLVWLAIMALALLWWRHKYNTIVKCPKNADKPFMTVNSSKESSNDSGFKDSPSFPVKVSAVQPITDTPNSSLKDHRGIPIQSDNTPSLYNSRTGRESYEAGYQLDSEPTSSSVSVQSVIPKNQEQDNQKPGVLQLKKMDSLKQDGNKKKHISSSGSEGSCDDFTKISRDSEDGLEKCVAKDNNSMPPDNSEISIAQCHVSVENSPPKNDSKVVPTLSREESFKGIPEMNSFGEYLQLVTIETPMSPREEFFSDMMVDKTPETAEIQMRAPRDRKSYCIGDLASAQQRITEARKSMPLFLYSSDIESGLDDPALPSTPPPSVLEIVNESPRDKAPPQISELPEQKEERTVLQAKAKPLHSSSGSKDSGKYFIANVLRTESITSEAYMTIEDNSPTTNGVKRWETNIDGSISSGQPSPDNYEGKWVLLSRDYAANNLEAFIRLESEAMARERCEGTSPEDEADNDSVFLESDQF